MEIHNIEDLLKVIEDKRVERGLSERELSTMVGKSPSIYWWWKRNTGTTSFATVMMYCKALGLKISVE